MGHDGPFIILKCIIYNECSEPSTDKYTIVSKEGWRKWMCWSIEHFSKRWVYQKKKRKKGKEPTREREKAVIEESRFPSLLAVL